MFGPMCHLGVNFLGEFLLPKMAIMGEMRTIHWKLSVVETLESVIFDAHERSPKKSSWKLQFLGCMMLYVNFPRCITYAVGIHRQ